MTSSLDISAQDTGPLINGRYQVIRRLGAGAQATVYEVSDTLLSDARLAFKVLHSNEMGKLFRFEFEQAKQLEHPHLARVFDLGIISKIDGVNPPHPGSVFFTQELVKGAAADKHAAGIPIPEKPLRVARIGVAAARALELIHGRGLLHRDVKPSNILVSEDGATVKLIDLGLSTHKDARDGLKAGTLGYIAPESLHGFPDERSDLFSLGVTMGSLLAGKKPRPFGPLAASPPPGTPEKLWAVVTRLCRPLPDERMETAGEVVLALARAMGASVLGDERAYDIIDASSDTATKTTRAARVRSPRLVGRDQELADLLNWLEEAMTARTDRRVSTAWLMGSAGVGKSRLFRAAVVEAQLGAARGGGRPPSFFAGTLRELMRHIAVAEDPRFRRLGTWVSGVIPEGENLEKETGRDALVVEMADAFLQLEEPAAVVIEDGENPLVYELMNRIAGQPRDDTDAALVMVAECRDTSKSEALQGGDTQALVMHVSPLKAADEAEIANRAVGRRLERRFVDRLHELTGGLPLLTEAVLAALLALRPDGSVDQENLDELDLEETLDELILRGFLKGVSKGGLAAAEFLAVLDGAADLGELSAVMEAPDKPAIYSGIRELEQNGWLTREEGRVRLTPLVGAGLHRSLSMSRKKALCRQALEVMEQRPHVECGQLARHAAGAGMKQRARRYAEEAAKVLMASGDLTGASEQLGLLIEMGTTSESYLDSVQTVLARLCRQTGQYRRAQALAREVEERGGSQAPKAALERAAALRLAGKTEEASRLLGKLIRSEDIEVALESRAIAARAALEGGHMDEASKLLEDLPAVDKTALMRTGVLSTAGLIALARGDHDVAREHFETGLGAAEAAGDLRNQARFMGLIGIVHHGQGDWQPALRSYRAALLLSGKAGDRHGGATYAVNLAAALTELGQLRDALDAYRTGLKMLRLVGRSSEMAQAGANYAELLLRLGDTDAAEVASRRAVADSDRSADRRARALALCVRGDVLMSLGKLGPAEETLEECHRVAEAANAGFELAVCRQHLASLWINRGDGASALEWLSKAGSYGGDAPASFQLEQQRLTLEVALLGRGDLASSLEKLVASLPNTGESLGEEHLTAFSSAARAAVKLGQSIVAGHAASQALSIISQTRAQTPSLHRQTESPLEKEMKMISDANSATASSTNAAMSWEHLVRINTRLNSEFRIGRLLDMIMDAALDITSAERGFLLIAGKNDELRVRSARNIDKQSLMPDEQNFSQTVARRAFELGEPVLTTDATEDERFQDRLSVMNLNLRYIVAVPLKVKGSATGTIYLDSRRGGQFDETRLALLEALANQAAIAFTNARLRVENRERQQRIEKLNRELASRLKNREGELERVRGELARRTDELITKYRYDEIVARSKPMAEVFRLLDKVVPSDFPLIIQGESGTGKELVARAVHFNGPRKRKAFVAENCAAIPETLLESVLFGHVKGAFTGAISDNRGLFVEAHGGTLFLDEIAEMPLAMQTKLLRVLQNGEVRPLGGTKTIHVDVRILVASNTDLRARVDRGAFREDLFYRLNVIKIALPALRKRREDIPVLAEHFVQKHGQKRKKRIAKEAVEALMDYPWPGNVRQLENEIVRALMLSDDVIDLTHLSDEVVSEVSRLSDATVDLSMTRQVDRVKRRLIAAALKRTGGNQTKAAELLGLSRYGLQKMISRLEGRS